MLLVAICERAHDFEAMKAVNFLALEIIKNILVCCGFLCTQYALCMVCVCVGVGVLDCTGS